MFLVVDNVWDDHIEDAQRYLNVGFHDGSMVLVMFSNDCTFKNAIAWRCQIWRKWVQIDVFLHYAGISRESIEDNSKWEIVRKCMHECCFLKGDRKLQCQKMICKVLEDQVGSMSLGTQKWDENLKKLKADKFNTLKDQIPPIFCILPL